MIRFLFVLSSLILFSLILFGKQAMLRGTQTQTPKQTTFRYWAILLLSLMFINLGESALAQSGEKLLQGILPALQSSNPLVQQEVIPLAQPEGTGEIVVEEKGEGLISLKVRDASLKQVVAMIAETQRINILFSAPQDIKMTGSLIRIPWRQALETVLASTGHTWTDDQGIIIVTTLAAAETIAPRAGGRRVETFELDFVKAVDVDQTVKGLLSPAGKSWVTLSSPDDNRMAREVIAVVDFPGNLQQIAEYICQIDQPPRQVLIKANILQVELKDDCHSGVNLQQLITSSGKGLDLSTVGLANELASPAAFLKINGGSLNGLIEFLQETTDAKSLAATELLTISGQEARLQSGEQLGYLTTTTTQTSSLQSVEFLDVGVQLSVIPHVTRDGRVMMRVKPEVSEGRFDPGFTTPSKDTVEVETDILLNSGQGLVIGGLIREVDSNVQTKVPWLGDIPYAGILFQKREVIKSRSEIIVTLVPYVMPYTPIEIARNSHRMMRATQPLLSPPLNRFPRPYEAQLPDTFTNPTPIFKGRMMASLPRATGATVLESSPPIDFSTPSWQEPPVYFPPTDISQPTLAPKQAARQFPSHR